MCVCVRESWNIVTYTTWSVTLFNLERYKNNKKILGVQGLLEVLDSVLEAPFGLDVVQDLLKLLIFKSTLQTGDQGFGLLGSLGTQVG